MMKVDLYHNIRWSRYKARIFSALHPLAASEGVDIRFTHISDTSGSRVALSGVDIDYHQYPHELLFPGNYEEIGQIRLASTLVRRVVASDAKLVLIPGYDKLEHWAMLLAAVFTGKQRGVFCDSTLLDRPQSAWKGVLKRVFFSACNGYFGYGRRSEDLLVHYGAPKNRVFQPCQAAALPDGYSEDNARRMRLCQPPRAEAPIFLFVGRLASEKSLDVLFKSFRQVLDTLPAARLLLVGSGPQAKDLKELAIDLGLGASIEFVGSMDQLALAQYYARATCLVLPSRSEPWGLVVNEALHYGCPVIVSDRCGCAPELVVNGITGYVFETGNPNDLSDKLLKLAATFSDQALVADRCLKHIGRYTPEAAAMKILYGCKTILSAARPAA